MFFHVMTTSPVLGSFCGQRPNFCPQPNGEETVRNRPQNIEQSQAVLPLLKELPRLESKGGKNCETAQRTRQKERLRRIEKAASKGKRSGKADEKTTGDIDDPSPPRKQSAQLFRRRYGHPMQHRPPLHRGNFNRFHGYPKTLRYFAITVQCLTRASDSARHRLFFGMEHTIAAFRRHHR